METLLLKRRRHVEPATGGQTRQRHALSGDLQQARVCLGDLPAPVPGLFGHTYHFLECALKSPDDQTLVWNLLLGEEARGRGAGGAGGPYPSAERGGAGQRAAAGGRALRLVAQAGGRQDGRVLQDLHEVLQLLGDVLLQQAGRHHRGPGPRVTVKQRPIVAGNAFRFLVGEVTGRSESRSGHAPGDTTWLRLPSSAHLPGWLWSAHSGVKPGKDPQGRVPILVTAVPTPTG